MVYAALHRVVYPAVLAFSALIVTYVSHAPLLEGSVELHPMVYRAATACGATLLGPASLVPPVANFVALQVVASPVVMVYFAPLVSAIEFLSIMIMNK